VVINEALAARLADLAGMTDPVGRPVTLHCPKYIERGTTARDVQIVGVIRSERVSAPPRPDPFVVYVPLAQVPQPDVKLIVRATAPPSVVVPAVRAAVAQVDPHLPVGDVVTLQEVRDRTLSGTSRPAWLIGVFAAAAALLAALGLYGVLAYAVGQRRREIGIRMALGAQSRDVVAWVLRGALATVAAGLVLGLAGTVALTRVLKTMLFDVSPLDPLALAAASVVMAAIGLLAGFVPASRAAGVQPVRVLREEG
jgi:predicted lysophospholipase L1 biosynthesis ABC-type transport system permease subunit